ncbi:hypothetical protein HOE425_320334 [Hoeflea sp. EC-HK425]|nr:hypothetical protein HOE425_320334 [Hoeflea sp. EC-HK425]
MRVIAVLSALNEVADDWFPASRCNRAPHRSEAACLTLARNTPVPWQSERFGTIGINTKKTWGTTAS